MRLCEAGYRFSAGPGATDSKTQILNRVPFLFQNQNPKIKPAKLDMFKHNFLEKYIDL